MKANELRVGNATNKGIVKSFYESGIHVGNGKCYPFSELEPIPLTPEILVKAGFVSPINRPEVFIKNRIQIFRECVYLVEEDTIKAHFIPIRLQHLHQLQNLYFAFTGEELNIEL
jgi:hypothetical protein